MDFRAVKIILASFLTIAFITPFFRLSVAMPKKGKDESVVFVKQESAGATLRTSGTLALAGTSHPSDSTATRTNE